MNDICPSCYKPTGTEPHCCGLGDSAFVTCPHCGTKLEWQIEEFFDEELEDSYWNHFLARVGE